MRWTWMLLFGLAGCSTAPLAGVLDWARPARMPQGSQPMRGGVCEPNPLPSQLHQPTLPAPGPSPTPGPPPPIDPRPPF